MQNQYPQRLYFLKREINGNKSFVPFLKAIAQNLFEGDFHRIKSKFHFHFRYQYSLISNSNTNTQREGL